MAGLLWEAEMNQSNAGSPFLKRLLRSRSVERRLEIDGVDGSISFETRLDFFALCEGGHRRTRRSRNGNPHRAIKIPMVVLLCSIVGVYPSLWADIESVAPKIGCLPQTLNEWVKRAESTLACVKVSRLARACGWPATCLSSRRRRLRGRPR